MAPLALQDKLKNELGRMESLNIIQKVTEPTQLVSSLVVVEKPFGKLRVCLDPKDLNRTILRPHYRMKTLEDVLPQLSKARFFTKVDARRGIGLSSYQRLLLTSLHLIRHLVVIGILDSLFDSSSHKTSFRERLMNAMKVLTVS